MSQTKAQLISDLVQALNFTGTASAPANGVFLSAANTLQLSTASTPRLTINSDGHVDVVGNLDVGAGIDVTGLIDSTGDLHITNNNPTILLLDSNANSDFAINVNDGEFSIQDQTNALTKRLSIASDGTVDVVGNLDVGAGLDVTGAITGTGDLTIDTDTLHVDSSNNRVGIGITAPLSRLHVEDVEGTTLTLGNTAAAASDGDYLSGIDFHIKDNNDGTGATCASIRTFADQNHTASAKGTALALFTTDDDTTTLDERLRITHDGKIGIGTTNPGSLLTLNHATNPAIQFQDSGTKVASINAEGSSTNIASFEGKDLVFATSTGSSFNTAMTIDTSQNVGIGTTTITSTGIQSGIKTVQIDSGDGAELILGNSSSQNVSANHIGAIAFKNIDTSTGNAPHYAGIRCNAIDTSGNMNLKFYAGATKFETDSPHMLINSSGDVGIGTTSLSDKFTIGDGDLKFFNSDEANNHRTTFIEFGGSYARITAESNYGSDGSSAYSAGYKFTTRNYTGSAFETLTPFSIQANGDIGIGTTSPANDGSHFGLTIAGKSSTAAGMLTFQDSGGNNDGRIFADNGVLVLFSDPSNSSGSSSMVFRVDTSTAKLRLMSDNEGFRMGGASDVTFDQLRVASGTSPQGCIFRNDGSNATSTSNQGVYRINRTTSDGTLINFLQNGTSEGSIDVSGSFVSYNGGHLSRWSQLSGISTTDKSARPTIYQGTVMSNLDELCTWTHADLLYEEDILYMPDETLPEGKSAGDIKHAKGDVLRAGYTEENQQLNMTKVSDTEGDKDVAGVFWAWDDDDDEIVNDFFIAMTGDMVIRVASSTTVARGDLLISAGDGTAKPQDDDIIRSSTIAKIISTNHTATYDDGSKAYPCVLMAC